MFEIYCKKLENDDYSCNIHQDYCDEIPYNMIWFILIVWFLVVCLIAWACYYYLFRYRKY